MPDKITAPCPRCGVDLDHHGRVTLNDWVPAHHDPEGKVRADLILECDACETHFYTFVALKAFIQVEEEPA